MHKLVMHPQLFRAWSPLLAPAHRHTRPRSRHERFRDVSLLFPRAAPSFHARAVSLGSTPPGRRDGAR